MAVISVLSLYIQQNYNQKGLDAVKHFQAVSSLSGWCRELANVGSV